MGDSRSSRDLATRSPHKPRVVRSQKIAASTSPTVPQPKPKPKPKSKPKSKPEPDDDSDDTDDTDDSDDASDVPPITRSHTPGHLASKSHDQRRIPSELSIRQRSQSGSQVAAPHPAPSSIAPSRTPAPPAPTPKPTASQAGSNAADSAEDGRPPQEVKRPPALRATSAIAGRGFGHPPPRPTTTRAATASSRHTRDTYIPFPPLQSLSIGPDVPLAAASGMYWSRAPVSGAPHPTLRAHTTTLIGSNIYVFGGCDAKACFRDLYVFDGDSFHWSKPHVVGDIPVPLRAMTCTAVGKKLVVFGGGDGPAYYNDVYVLDTVNFRWSRPRIVGDRVPSKRRAHTACLYKSGIYIFGGGDGVRALNDVWRLDVSDVTKMSWKLVSAPDRPGEDGGGGGGGPGTGPSPPASTATLRPKARGYHTANMVSSNLIIFGGSDGGECFNDVWVYDVEGHTWKCASIPVAYRRLSHTATIVGSYLFVIGGHDGNEYSNDVLLLNLVTMTWDRKEVYGRPPSGRGYHGTVLYDSRLFVVGGFDGGEVFGDVWMLELAVHAYYSQISHFSIVL